MRKLLLFFSILFLGIEVVSAQKKGVSAIHFMQDSKWESVIEKATQSNKLIYVYYYTNW